MNPPDALDIPRDRWLRRFAALRETTGEDGRGRVLRLKLGYNPNSSSVGSVVTTLLWSASASAVVLNVAAALVRRRWQERPSASTGAPSDPEGPP